MNSAVYQMLKYWEPWDELE